MAKVIFHIDLNAFFASAEILMDPSLKGKPVAVSGLSRRSVVSTASYEARLKGVHSAMPIKEALELCPELIVVKGHHSFYHELSHRFIEYIKTYTPFVEQASIDECYADMTEAIKRFKKPLDLAWQIQQNLSSDLGLNCSIGVAPNKFLAKMASDMHKPKGITVMRKQEVKSKLWPLRIEEMRGIGKKTAPILRSWGIETIGDLAVFQDTDKLRTILGKNTQIYIDRAHGEDDSELVLEEEAKSLSQSTTLNNDISDDDEVRQVFTGLAEKLSLRIAENGVEGTILSISIRYFDFHTAVRSKKLSKPISSKEELLEQALSLFDENKEDQPIRLLGIGLSSLTPLELNQRQISLFEVPDARTEKYQLLSEINQKLKKGKVLLASSLLQEKKK